MGNPFFERLLPAPINGGFRMQDYHIWCGSVIKGEDGKYHMFASRWPKDYGFAAQWLFNCEIVRAVSDTPEGPYAFEEVVFQRRERSYFDALNQHNPSIKYWNGTYYLYYFGTTYGGPIPTTDKEISSERYTEVWNKKRIGLATSKSINGPWERPDAPLLEPRDCEHWDCTITTNPSAAILPDGTTYMIYKSREYVGATLQLGVARAPHPEGPYTRLQEDPIFHFDNPDFFVEDPFLWWDNGTFHILIKDDYKNDCGGITGDWGAGIYATSVDCLNWEIHSEPKAYSRNVLWEDGSKRLQANLERPNILFEDGKPTHLFLATGKGDKPWHFEGATWNMVIPLDVKSE